jgi:ATP-binding cassette, subfamily F, member 3
MLRASALSKFYGGDAVLRNINLTVTPGQRVGLIGPNGAGKTTLLRLLAGQDKPDTGSVWRDPNARIATLDQGLSFDPGARVADVLRDPRDGVIEEIERLAEALAHAPEQMDAYQRALDRLDAMGGYPNQAARDEVLAQLGLGALAAETPVTHLSGGQKTRLGLARVLLGEPNLLLLDEPTNHLDIAMLEWLERWLTRFDGAALIVSHDRVFLDHAANLILELDSATHALKSYPGNYSAYLEAKLDERAQQAQAYQDQQAEIARLSDAAAHLRGIAKFRVGGKADSGDKFAKGFFANRGKQTVARAKRIEARVDKLLGEDHIDKPRATWQLKVDFEGEVAGGQDVLVLEHLSVGYGDHAVLRDVSLHIRRGERVALLGDNGSGKSTLVKTIAGALPPLSGVVKIGPSVKLGYFAQEQEQLDPQSTPLETLRREAPQGETEARNFLHYFLFAGDQPLKRNALLSFGERARLQLALLVARGCTFLLLDEPINHLDLPSRNQFEQALAAFGGTTLAVTHDRYFVQGFATRIAVADGGTLREAPM